MPSSDSNDTLRTGGILRSHDVIPYSKEIRDAVEATVSPSAARRISRTARKVRVRRITYRSGGHDVTGYVVEPRRASEKLPCIVFNRGGSKDFGQLDHRTVFAILGMMASWGYVVIASQYSGNDGSEGKDEFGGADLEDVLVLPRVLRRHAFADTTRIGMYGGSRGGTMTYMCMTRAKWIRAAVVTAGVADLVRQVKLRPEMKSRFKEMFGGSVQELKKRSAVEWPDRFPKNVPLLIMHGTADWRVSPLDSLDLSAKLLDHGVHHRLVLFEGDDHGLTAHRREKWSMVREWFDAHVRG